MLTGVNDSSKETKFVSGTYKLVEGKHLTSQDKNKVLIHKDLAKKNNLKVGDKINVPGIGEVEVQNNSILDPNYKDSPDSGVVLLPERTIFTKENMDKYDF